MSQDRETNLALFIDFDNVALGARDARQRFDIKLLLQRVLEKGKVIVKKAYADWHYYKEHMSPLHEAAIELIEIPMPRISGKNSADIKLVVDAMDLCYSKDHIDTFVIVSGDSDFSPLVSKLRENNKRVIGIGVKNSSSHLLIHNCDEFMFYDDIYRNAVGMVSRTVSHVPEDKQDLFDFLVNTAQGLLQESRGVLYSSLIKDTMTRKQPDFNERNFGFNNFGELLDEARRLGLLVVERDARAGGTWVVHGMGSGKVLEAQTGNGEGGSSSGSRSSRRRRGGRGRGRAGDGERTPADQASAEKDGSPQDTKEGSAEAAGAEKAVADKRADDRKSDLAEKASTGSRKEKSERGPQEAPAPEKTGAAGSAAAGKGGATKGAAKKAPAKKAAAKKTPAKKRTTKKTTTKKTATKKTTTKKAPAKKTTAKKAPARKAPAKKAPAKKAPGKKAPARKAPAKKTAAKKPEPDKGGSS
jgi:uncharacterized protein (TIGR00288 family)